MPAHGISAFRTSKRSATGLSIRARLMLLALLAVVPLMLDRVRQLETSRTERIEMAYGEVVDLANRSADAQLEIINATRALLQVVARTFVAMTSADQNCPTFLAGLATDVSWIRGFSVVGENGRIVCSTRRNAIGLDVSDRDYIQAARQSGDFVLSDYLVERVDHRPAIIAAYPVLGKNESVNMVILAPVDLQWAGRLGNVVGGKPGAVAILIDDKGTVLSSTSDRERLAGRNFVNLPLVSEALSRAEGTVTTEGLDGARRIFAFTRLPGTEARIIVGLDARTILSRIDREIGIAYLQLALFGLLILLAAWFGGERLIVDPIRTLSRTAIRIGRGDLEARPARDKWAPEFAPLASALAEMATKLAERENELRLANRHLEELASIDSLSGLANRRSFDARLDTEWRRTCDLRRPIGLMMIDIDYFKLFNDSYGHVEGDHCLRLVGEVLSSFAGNGADLAARYGGEEFVLLLPDAPLSRVLELAEELRAEVEAQRIANVAAPGGHVTISIGVASLVPTRGEAPRCLIEAADAGLYRAKRCGRNVVCADTPISFPKAS